jgi:MIP family channel proteins
MASTPRSGATSVANVGGDGTDDRPDQPSVGGSALAELIGTFMLLFFGTAAIMAAPGAADAAQKLLIAFAFGLAILAAVYTFGHVSGAHLNPAVTLSLVASRRFPASAAPVYIVAQVVGAVLGVLAVAAVFDGDLGSTATVPGEGVSAGQALLIEVLLGFVLVLVVKATAVDDRAEGPSSGLAIGLTIVIGHLAFIPISGSSFNPARTLGSAIVGGEADAIWVYLIGPVIGGVIAALLYENVLRKVRPPDVDDPERRTAARDDSADPGT